MNPAATSTFDIALIWQIAGWAVVGIGGLVLLWALFRDRSRGRRRCPKCWYDMKGVPGLRCPECGREAKHEKTLHKSRRRWNWAVFASILMLVGYSGTRVPSLMKDGPIAATPTPVLRAAAWFQRARAKDLFDSLVPSASTSLAGVTRTQTQVLGGMTDWEKLLAAWHAEHLLNDAELQAEAARDYTKAPRAALAGQLFRSAGKDARVAVPELVSAIDSGIGYLAIDFLRDLAALGDRDALIALDRATREAKRPEARTGATGALTTAVIARGDGRHMLHALLAETDDPNIAWAIANAAAASFTNGGATLGAPLQYELLTRALTHKNETCRTRALGALRPQSNWQPIESTLIELLEHDPSRTMRMRIAEFIRGSALSRKWGLPLVRAGEDEDPNVRLNAIETLLHWSGTERWPGAEFADWLAQRDAESPLADGTKRDPLLWVRAQADRGRAGGGGTSVLAVRKVHRFAPGHPELLPTYQDWARNQPEPMARAAAVEAIAEFGVTTPSIAVGLLREVLENEDNGWVRIAAVRELPLRALDDPQVLDLLAVALVDEERDVRFVAASVAGVLAKPHAKIEESLAAMREDPDSALARMAESALMSIRLGHGDAGILVPWGTRIVEPPKSAEPQ